MCKGVLMKMTKIAIVGGGAFLLLIAAILVTNDISFKFATKRYTDAAEHVKIARAKTDLECLRQPLEMFKIISGRYPTIAEGLNALIMRPPNIPGAADDWPLLQGGVPLDPWGHSYIYRCPSTRPNQDFDLLSAGPDGKEGTADDIVCDTHE